MIHWKQHEPCLVLPLTLGDIPQGSSRYLLNVRHALKKISPDPNLEDVDAASRVVHRWILSYCHLNLYDQFWSIWTCWTAKVLVITTYLQTLESTEVMFPPRARWPIRSLKIGGTYEHAEFGPHRKASKVGEAGSVTVMNWAEIGSFGRQVGRFAWRERDPRHGKCMWPSGFGPSVFGVSRLLHVFWSLNVTLLGCL